MAPTAIKAKSSKSVIGAPAQRNQASRKGKRAWRKHIDDEDVEERLEELRVEERITGSALHQKQNSDLFVVDTQGDETLRKRAPRFSTAMLTSSKIIAQRSAVPAVSTRATKRKAPVSYDDKTRMLRVAKRARRGPLNSIVDPAELGAGSALLDVSAAVKSAGTYDPWTDAAPTSDSEDDIVPKVKKIKAPKHTHPRDFVDLPPVAEPHQGTSYNPLASAHQDLLRTALDAETTRLRDAEQADEWHAKLERVRQATVAGHAEVGVPAGMAVMDADDGEEEIEGGDGVLAPKSVPKRKTKSQRLKAAKALAEKRALADKAAQRRFLASVAGAKAVRRGLHRNTSEREHAHAQRMITMQETLKRGLAGRRIGRNRVPESHVEVQLGEELSESFRALKPEGSLFRDRFVSLQQRGLLEPRALNVARRKLAKTKEYEKHAWKRFQ